MALMSQMALFFQREALEWPGPQAWCPVETQAHEDWLFFSPIWITQP